MRCHLRITLVAATVTTDLENPVSLCRFLRNETKVLKELYLDCLYSTHWEDELLLQVSQAFLKEQEEEEEEDSLLLTALQNYKKRCGSLIGF